MTETALEKVSRQKTALAQKPVDIESLLMRAAESNLSVEGMRELMAMRRELKAEAALEAYTAAMAALQSKMPPLVKTKDVTETKGENRGRLRYRYAPLEDVQKHIAPWCKRFGFSYSFATQTDITRGEVIKICYVRHEAGHVEAHPFGIPIDAGAYMSTPQKFGSASSFSKRYALIDAFAVIVVGEDDDAASLGGNPREQQRKSVQQPRSRSESVENGAQSGDNSRQAETSTSTKSPTGAQQRSRDLRQNSSAAVQKPDTGKINEQQVAILKQKMQQATLDDGDFYKRFGLMSVSSLPMSQINEALDWIKDPVNK